MKKIVILFSGEGTNLLNLIERLHNRHCQVAAAITNRPDAPGIAKAKAHGILTEVIDHKSFDTRENFDEELVKTLRHYAPDLVVMAGFMRILTPIFTEQVDAINLHPSLLPLFKGGNAIEESFESEHPLGGVSVHWVTTELDSGGVILQDSFEKAADETLESFTQKIRAIEHELLPKAVITLLEESAAKEAI